MAKKTYVAKKLEEAAKTYDQRNEIYGDAYKRNGHIAAALFPDGITLETPEEFNRFFLMFSVVGKMNRYASQFEEGGHEDSALDASVYAAMLNEIDNEAS